MTDREKKIAEIRENHSTGHYNYNYEVRDAIHFLLDELDKRNEENQKLRERLKEELVWQDECLKLEEQLQSVQQDRDKLVEGLHNYMKELDRRCQKAYRNYDIDCDHHQLGMAEAYEVAERRLRDILKEIGVTVE